MLSPRLRWTLNLEKEISQRVKAFCDFLSQQGILDPDGLIEYIEEKQ